MIIIFSILPFYVLLALCLFIHLYLLLFFFNQRDNTKPGHCLGDATSRSLDAIPERELPRISVIFQQHLIHLSMFVSCLYGNQQVRKNFQLFLWIFFMYQFLISKFFQSTTYKKKLRIKILNMKLYYSPVNDHPGHF